MERNPAWGVNKQRRQAYQAIKEVCQDHHGWQSILLEYIGVSRQAYGKFLKRKKTQWEINNEILTEHVLRIFELHNGSVGAGKILLDLEACDDISFKVTLKQVKRVMRDQMITCVVRRKKKSRKNNEQEYIKDNILNQNFKVYEKCKVWLADSTQLEYGVDQRHTVQLSGVLDLHGRRMISWHISPSEDTEAEISVFEKAFERMGDVHPMVHTDRGSAYVSNKFNNYLVKHQVVRSMSRPGTPFDNAPIERFWNDFKLRWIDLHGTPKTLEELIVLVEEGMKYFDTVDRSEKRNGLTNEEFWGEVA
ncbi:IS3 family transposase [Companilactobacillus futsaii]|uniref:Integrase catalytic domain-containing protein n=1 Tax=Companilactobacillus futsaii JCM 17355 TaxID=1423818 RepID=A0ABR5P549_9LACO|nr:IS3 family transposase [Companilactobacillus futsaii]KRK92450.1 hypothetical protein FC88_GL000739 [Companilactobacillus futsaii JCM 17355]